MALPLAKRIGTRKTLLHSSTTTAAKSTAAIISRMHVSSCPSVSLMPKRSLQSTSKCSCIHSNQSNLSGRFHATDCPSPRCVGHGIFNPSASIDVTPNQAASSAIGPRFFDRNVACSSLPDQTHCGTTGNSIISSAQLDDESDDPGGLGLTWHNLESAEIAAGRVTPSASSSPASKFDSTSRKDCRSSTTVVDRKHRVRETMLRKSLESSGAVTKSGMGSLSFDLQLVQLSSQMRGLEICPPLRIAQGYKARRRLMCAGSPEGIHALLGGPAGGLARIVTDEDSLLPIAKNKGETPFLSPGPPPKAPRGASNPGTPVDIFN